MNEQLKQAIEEANDKYSFVVPYDGSNNFYNDEKLKHYPDIAKDVLSTPSILRHADPEIMKQAGWEPKKQWISVEDMLPEEGRLVELVTTCGDGCGKAFEIYRVENAHQTNRTLYYRGTISKATWDLKEWSHWRYYNQNDLPKTVKP